MMSTVGVRVELGARNQRGACLAGHTSPDRRREARDSEPIQRDSGVSALSIPGGAVICMPISHLIMTIG